MDWTRAAHHVEFAASECARVTELPAATTPVHVTGLWAFGAILGRAADLDNVSVALTLDLPPQQVPWLSRPPAAEHWLKMTRLHKNPVRVHWRSAHAPVWNHTIVRPLLVWDDTAGLSTDALQRIRDGKGRAGGLAEPDDEQLQARLAAELGVSLESLRVQTQAYADRQWTPTKLGPTADALYDASVGYLDVLDAVTRRATRRATTRAARTPAADAAAPTEATR